MDVGVFGLQRTNMGRIKLQGGLDNQNASICFASTAGNNSVLSCKDFFKVVIEG